MPPACCEKSPCAILCRKVPTSATFTANRVPILKGLLVCYVVCIFLAVFATLGALNSKALRVPASAAMMCTDPRKATFVGRRRFGAR